MIGRLVKTVIDWPDPRALAAFYAAVLGVPVVQDSPEWVAIGADRPTGSSPSNAATTRHAAGPTRRLVFGRPS